MNKKSPIFIHEVKFDSFTLDNVPQTDDDLIFFSYSGEDEFQAGDDFGGIAAMITIVNTNHRKHPARGTRRRVLLTLFDETDDLIVASRLLRVDIPKTEGIFIVYESFHVNANSLCGSHTYRMALEDTSTERMLGEYYFRLCEPEEDGGDAPLSAEDLDYALDEFIARSDGDSDETVQAADWKPQPEPLRLESLTGLKAVKDKLAVYERVVRFNRLRADHNLPTSPTPLHAMFLGSPGTGKTTVAKMMGEMLRDAGVLSRGHVVVRERSNLIGIHYNSEGENTLKAIEEAQGGILLIDEAYHLYQPQDARDPGKCVIETLRT
ncbi:MAG: AAA family ATPase, partial [Muribaculaceae bacterium]|nr:AAA family ATPase [Muribaculaceae bacterium]